MYENLIAHRATLYHRKIQYANIRPPGRDDLRQRKINSFAFQANYRTYFQIFKYKQNKKKAGHNPHTNDERKVFLLAL